MSEIFLDIETTGLSFKEKHRIVEIACIETNQLLPTKKLFHKLINPEREVPEEAFNIHGHSTNLLKTKQKFSEVADEFLSFIKDKDIIVHNAKFDIPFLNFELKLSKKNEIKNNNIIDTLDISRSKYPGTSNSLDALCKRFNVDLSRRTKHNALLDCELLREVYINLLDAKEPKLSFISSVNEKNELQKKLDYSKKILSPTEKELQDHNKFIKAEMKKNYF
jgi:DNA polymerase-3 subunit epsilon|tara:strand:- start:1598 stop:2260 length:663 start_codon:yes stop_codon:yes gene_type:complete